MSQTIPQENEPTLGFSQLKLPEALLSSLNEAGYQQMTPIQSKSLPAILEGIDVIVQAETGSGKTAAFALGILSRLNTQVFSPQALVLCPTRELAEQVANEIRKLAKAMANIKVLTLCGGVPARAQAASLQHGAHILVGTPGRILDHLQQQRLDLSTITSLVLDEADRMLDMGFQDELDTIVKNIPTERQTLLFSATYPASIATLAKQVAINPTSIKVEATQTTDTIKQLFYTLSGTSASVAVMQVLQNQQPANCIVFCNTKREAKEVTQALKACSYSVLALHGDLEQRERDQAIVQFSNGSARVLVATDVAARGLDITGLDLVLCVNMAHDLATHTHRIGRTGRAGANGLAITLVSPQDDYKLRLFEDSLIESSLDAIQLLPLPTEQGNQQPLQASMVTIQISGGKKDKLRPGDIVGALTRDSTLKVDDIGKIKLQSTWGFIAVNRRIANHALKLINSDKIKGKRFRAQVI